MAVNAEVPGSKTGSARVAVQRFGTFLSGMIMPNIAAFIAWGFITAFFIETGWTPVEGLGGSARMLLGPQCRSGGADDYLHVAVVDRQYWWSDGLWGAG